MTASIEMMVYDERGLAYGQRALAIATASGDFALEMMATFNLGLDYSLLGNYRQAIHFHRKNVEALLFREWLYGHLGNAVPLSVTSRFRLVRSLASSGTSSRATPRGQRRCGLPRRSGSPSP